MNRWGRKVVHRVVVGSEWRLMVLGTLLITWREGIEAALIVGILLTYLTKLGESRGFSYVYGGVFAAVVASLGFAYFSSRIGFLFEGVGEDLFDVMILFLAIGVMTHMVFFMHRHARELKGELHRKVARALAQRQLWVLFTITFVGVFREGVETVLFLWGLALQQSVGSSYLLPFWGGVMGLALAVGMAWLFFRGFGHLNLRPFFRVTGVLLLILAAGLLTTGIRKLIGSDLFSGTLPGWATRSLWDSSWLLDERSLSGSLAAGLLGYASHPSILEVFAYVSYLGIVLLFLRLGSRSKVLPGKGLPASHVSDGHHHGQERPFPGSQVRGS